MRAFVPTWLALVLVAQAHAAVEVRRVAKRLGDEASTWTLQPQPHSTWREQGARSTVSTADDVSRLELVPAPSSSFMLADVPPERLDATRHALGELHARPARDGAVIVDLPGDVLFDFDKSDLRADALPVLERIVRLLDAFPTRAIAIHGHTDSKGTDAYNDALSRRRADAVRAFLAQHDPAHGRRYDVQGFGEARPVAPNLRMDGSDDPEGRQRNRRVEIVLQAPKVR